MSERERIPLPDFRTLEVPLEFAARLDAVGVRLDAAVLAEVGGFLGLLLAMNERVNLTAIVEPGAVWERHALDALSLLPDLTELSEGARVADLGSGGGVPAIPLALARRELAFTLVESIHKKAAFLDDAARRFGLERVEVLAERAEDVGRGPKQGTFDAVTARAVAKLSALVPLAAPLLRPLGRMIFIKGQRAGDELSEAAGALRRARVRHLATRATPTGRVVVLEKLPER
ncbi:MAG: 16S rRNA (guanine(527)-N(7))-methyltransferase RsmG [Deltaproteobacteria bacterium]|nr:16S rRNA (guanine(527)-N(7))-methyltransferase RsmG [Deltaproteobacteria bacterium]